MASLKLGSGTAAISSGVIAIYLFAFAFLIAIFEVHCGCTARAIAHNLGFMYRATGRFMFFLLVGLLCFSGYHALGTFTGVFMLFTAVFNGFIMFKYPAYERSMRIVDLGE
ncbi:hypothetical protein M885DRAFT_521603 [Pelagophyceae sp. CCMP2097]|nr:hypothetical protein M885DRAFT_521603 [Pelagophyceae sp. CCMP2097]